MKIQEPVNVLLWEELLQGERDGLMSLDTDLELDEQLYFHCPITHTLRMTSEFETVTDAMLEWYPSAAGFHGIAFVENTPHYIKHDLGRLVIADSEEIY